MLCRREEKERIEGEDHICLAEEKYDGDVRRGIREISREAWAPWVELQQERQRIHERQARARLELVHMLAEKAEGGGISKDVNVVELAFQRYKEHGTLQKEGALHALEAVPDYPPNELEAGG